MNEKEYEMAILRKKELQEKIKENMKLMELIKKPQETKKETPIFNYKMHFYAKKIQKFWKSKRNKTKVKEISDHTLNFIKTGGNLSYKLLNSNKLINPFVSMIDNIKFEKQIITIQRNWRRRKMIKYDRYLKNYYCKEFERILLDNYKPDACEESRKLIIKFIYSNENISDKNLQLVIFNLF